MNWYLKALKKYAVFGGRARRKEYWLFVLFHILIIIVLGIIDGLVGLGTGGGFGRLIVGLLGGLYSLAVLIPGIAVFFRRLHDTGHSGWWWLIGLVPLVGAVVLLIFMVRDSEPYQNQYGPNPKQVKA